MVKFLSIFFFFYFFSFCWVFQKFPFFCVTLYTTSLHYHCTHCFDDREICSTNCMIRLITCQPAQIIEAHIVTRQSFTVKGGQLPTTVFRLSTTYYSIYSQPPTPAPLSSGHRLSPLPVVRRALVSKDPIKRKVI